MTGGVIGIRLRGVVLAAVVMTAVGFGCAREAAEPAVTPATAHELPPAGDLSHGASIFDLDLDLVDQQGAPLKLAGLRGQVMLTAMVYTSCKDVCILVTEQMKTLEQQLAGVDRDVRYALFSLDPGRDTPEVMRAFARAHRLDDSRWRLMAASEDGVRDLAAVLGVRYQAEESGEIAHSAMIFVIDEDGVVQHRQVGVGKDASELVAAVRRARG